MKRKVYHWADDGSLEFSPPIGNLNPPDMKGWMEEEEYNALPEIDDDDLLVEYETACFKVHLLKTKILDKAWRKLND